MVAGCFELGVIKLAIEMEALLANWLVVNVKVGDVKETNVPPVRDTDRPDWTAKGMVRETVYVTPKSKGSEKYRVYNVAELVTKLLDVTIN